MRSTFPLAINILGLLMSQPTKLFLVSELATHAKARPGDIRNVVRLLERKQIVLYAEGLKGGVRLGIPPPLITLADVYRALALSPLLAFPQTTSDYGDRINDALAEAVDKAIRRFMKELDKNRLLDAMKPQAGSRKP